MSESARRNPVQLATLTLLFASVLLANSVAANTVVCVPQDMSLGAALNQAQTTAMTIQIVQDSYNLAGTVWHAGVNNLTHVRGGTQVLGGYTAGCASRNIEVGNTILFDSVNAGAADGADPRGDLTVEGITFENQNGLVFNATAGELGGVALPAGTTILLRRNAFINSANSVTVYWGQSGDIGGVVRMVDNLIANNLAPYCFVAIVVSEGSPEAQVINNTVVGNAGTGSTGGCFFNHHVGSGNATFRLYNNIFYANTATYDLATDDTSVALVDNVIGTRFGPSPNTEAGTQTGDPKLDANYHPIEAPASPVINSGNDNPPGGLPSSDLDGGPRVVGSRVDRGAFESSIENGAVQTVTNNNDSGTGSLRAAVDSVDFNNGGTIKFAFAGGSCPHVITLDSELSLTAAATVNGYSDPDATVNTLDVGDDASICVIVEANSSLVTPPGRGLVVPSNQGDAVSVTIKGLAFSGFSTAGIDLQGGSQHLVVGNHFGGSVGGHALQPNGYDVRFGGNGHDSAIGSGDVADRNIIGDATGSGIVVASGSTNNQIIGNYIGVGWSTGSSNYTIRGNGARGIYVAGDNNTISGNLIGHNAQAGIVLDSLGAHDNLITQNLIGTDLADVDLGNANSGIHLIGDSGGTGNAPNNNTIRFNTIAHNGAQGVLVDVGQGNRIRKNSIYGNASLGIDLDVPGVTANDDDSLPPVTDQANHDQNFPVLASATGGFSNGTVTGSLPTLAGDYTLDFYNSPGCNNRDSRYWLGGVSVTVPGTAGSEGELDFNQPINAYGPFGQLLDGSVITATATDANGNTSELSACVNYVNDTLFHDGFEGPPPTF